VDEREREGLRSSLGVPRKQVDSPGNSTFGYKLELFISSLPGDFFWQMSLTGILWPISLFYLTSNLVGTVVLQVIFWLLIIFEGWPIYFIAAFFTAMGSLVYKDFRSFNRWVRYIFWGACLAPLLYFLYPFDIKAHEKTINSSSSHILQVEFPAFESTANRPRIYIDKNYANSWSEFKENLDTQLAFYQEFKKTCQVGLAIANDGIGALIWKEKFDEIEFVLISGETMRFSSCEDFEPKKGKISVKFRPTWEKINSVDVWGRFDFVGDEFSDTKAPGGVKVEVLLSDINDGVNFTKFAEFELKDSWYGEVTIQTVNPMLGKLYIKAQKGLPEVTSETIRFEPNSK